uniref:Phosphatidylinositol-glycan biosynthesis class W protein n=1 Tax=Phallusia mammillata TaxID=59560 RepID=A0A6F9DPB0_9ASCI|nr:phosphatidylinositol-glycan biosynthesis class W protein-like [Phallusia mammillata]
MDEQSLTVQKVKFVSNLNGTSTEEVILISTISAASLLLRAAVICIMPKMVLQNSVFRYLIDFIVVFLPLLLSVTVFSEYLIKILVSIIVFAISILWLTCKLLVKQSESVVHSCYVAPSFYQDKVKPFGSDSNVNSSDMEEYYANLNENMKNPDAIFLVPSNLPFVTTFRAFVNIASCICILAVDFDIFPRRFAKVETYGVSVMDLGVGGFVVANALVSPEARNNRRQEKSKSVYSGFLAVCLQIISTWPLVMLGIIRLVSVKMSGYQEHVSEYGVHWNFFFTLALVRILSTFVLAFINIRLCGLVSFLIAAAYQYALNSDSASLTNFLLSNAYDGNLLVQNKEGIASSIGTLALYLAGIQMGAFLFKPRHTFLEWKKASVGMFALTMSLGLALNLSISLNQPVSRRIGNLSYILWMLYYAAMFLFQYLFVDLLLVFLVDSTSLPLECMPNRWLMLSGKNAAKDIKIIYTPVPPKLCLLSAINRNQLFYFLLCNLLTGAVNFTINTLLVDTKMALVIIIAYCLFGSWLIWCLHLRRITLKFW